MKQVSMAACGACVALAGCGVAPGGTATTTPGLQQAMANYPAMILGGNVHATDGIDVPRACPAPGARVEQKGGPTFEYGGADPSNPALCVMRVDGQVLKGWYGIWLTDWPGADQAAPGLGRLMASRSGDVVAFDTNMKAGYNFHDLMRNDGVEDIALIGRAFHTLKISHYREGYDGNDYRSVATVWKDIPTGMIVYATYNHIAGRPEVDDPLIPTAIVPAPAR